jgi:hypothetical protein
LIAAGYHQKPQGQKARYAAADQAQVHSRLEACQDICTAGTGSLDHREQTDEKPCAYNPDKNHKKAIDLLETDGIEVVADEYNCINALVSKTAALLAESKLCKQEKNFEKSIALLEEARQLLGQ